MEYNINNTYRIRHTNTDDKLVSGVYATVHKHSIDACEVEYPLLRIMRRTPLGSQLFHNLQEIAIDCDTANLVFPDICCFSVFGKDVPDEQKLVVMCNFAYITIGVGLKRNVRNKQIDTNTYHLWNSKNFYSTIIGVNTAATVKFFTAKDAENADLSCMEFYNSDNPDQIINQMVATLRNQCSNPEDMPDWADACCFAVYTGNDSTNLRLMVSVGYEKIYLGVGM